MIKLFLSYLFFGKKLESLNWKVSRTLRCGECILLQGPIFYFLLKLIPRFVSVATSLTSSRFNSSPVTKGTKFRELVSVGGQYLVDDRMLRPAGWVPREQTSAWFHLSRQCRVSVFEGWIRAHGSCVAQFGVWELRGWSELVNCHFAGVRCGAQPWCAKWTWRRCCRFCGGGCALRHGTREATLPWARRCPSFPMWKRTAGRLRICEWLVDSLLL